MAEENRAPLGALTILTMLYLATAAQPQAPPADASTHLAKISVEEFWWEVQTEVTTISAQMQTQCPEQQYTCLHNGSLAQHAIEREKFKDLCSLCRCDADCLMYGDCCADFAAAVGRRHGNATAEMTLLDSGHPQPHDPDSVKVVDAEIDAILSEPPYELDQDRPVFVCSALDFQATGVYMVGSCPSKFSDMTTQQLCRRQVSGEAYTYLVDLPVTSATTNLTYVNYYCALCHADAHNLHSWTISIHCRGLSEGTTMQEFMQSARYEPGLRLWQATTTSHLSGALRKTICLLKAEEFSSTSLFAEQFGGRQCLKPKPICPAGDLNAKCSSQVRACPETWTDQRVKEKCEQYSMLAVHNRVTYRNPHCALCNGVNLTELSCMPTKGCVRRHRINVLPQAFSTLIDFKSANCSDQDLFDPLNSKCHRVKCGSLFTFKSGVCVRDESAPLTSGISYLNHSCPKVSIPKEEFVISQNDSSVTVTSTNKQYHWGQYELDENLNLLVCNYKYVYLSTITYPQKIVTFVVLMISVICLTIHIIIFCLFPKMRNLPGKNLCSLSFSLLMAHFLLLTGMHAHWHSGICIIVGISLHYFWLASFCWMNVMSLDVFITFKRAVHRGSDGTTKTFLGYALYSWGVPLLVILSALIVQFTDFMSQYKPQYNRGSLCWINNRDALILFFLMPIGVIILENVALFIVTSYGIYQQSKYSKFAKMRSQSVKKHGNSSASKETKSVVSSKNKAERKDRIRFLLYIKLGIIQGLTWSTGFLAAITGLPACWYLFTVLNGLQGFFIFLSFDLKKKVWQSIHENFTGKLWSLRSSRGTSTTTLTTATSSARRFQRSLQSSRNQKNCGPSDTAGHVEGGSVKQSEKTTNVNPQESRAVVCHRKTNVEILDKNSSISGRSDDQNGKSLDKSVKKSFEIEKMKDFLKQLSQDNKPTVKHNRSASDIRHAGLKDQQMRSKSTDSTRPEMRRTLSTRDSRRPSEEECRPQTPADLRACQHQLTSAAELNNRPQGKGMSSDKKQLKSEPRPIERVNNHCRPTATIEDPQQTTLASLP